MRVPSPRPRIDEVRNPFVVVHDSFALAFTGASSSSTIWIRSVRAWSFATTSRCERAETSPAEEGLERVERGRRRCTTRRLRVGRVRMLLLLGRRRSRSRRVCRRFRCVIVGVVGRDAWSRLRRRRWASTARLWLLLLLLQVLTLLAPAQLALVGARQHVFLVAVLGAAHRDRRSCCCCGALGLLVLLLLRRIL